MGGEAAEEQDRRACFTYFERSQKACLPGLAGKIGALALGSDI